MVSDLDKVALVTGAAGGIGREIAHRLLADGWRVALVDRDLEMLRSVATELPGECQAFPCDLAVSSEIEAVCKTVIATFGIVTALVNCAGLVSVDRLETYESSHAANVWQINLDAGLVLARALVPQMPPDGRIVFLSSEVVRSGGQAAGLAYVASKGAVEAVTRTLAKDLARRFITVNAVAPGFVLTPMARSLMDDEALADEIARVPIGRATGTDEVAHAVAFLLSPLAGAITGETLNINGGSTLSVPRKT